MLSPSPLSLSSPLSPSLSPLPYLPPSLPTHPSLPPSLQYQQTYMHIEVLRWVLCGVIGVCTGLIALFIDVCVRYLFKLKFSLFDRGGCLSHFSIIITVNAMGTRITVALN